MKLLWITNVLFPDICNALGRPAPAVGGWMYSSAKQLIEGCDIQLAVAAICPGSEYKVINVNNIRYYLLPLKTNPSKYEKKLEKYWREVEADFKPDVIHIHGTEFSHGLAYIKTFPENKVVVSIQGLVGVYSRYYYAGLSYSDILKNISFRDIVRNDNLFQQHASFRKQGYIERSYILSSRYVIGRTEWDRTHTQAINENIRYYFCNETLRPAFYEQKWKMDECVPHTIFCSQASYPIKGLHQLLKALPAIIRQFPDTMLYVAGRNITERKTWMQKIKTDGYAKYIRKLIRKLGIADHVVFLGMVDEHEMCKRYLQSNVFVCPSSIENSPNSLGEAQLLGIPCVASYVGGVPDMIDSGKDGILYRFEEIEMLARAVCSVFNDEQYALKLSQNAQLTAAKRHDPLTCRDRLFQIYNNIVSDVDDK